MVSAFLLTPVAATSGAGGGAVLIVPGGQVLAWWHLQWPVAMQRWPRPIAILECAAAYLAISRWAPSVASQHLRLYSDNFMAVCSWQAGSARDPAIRALVRAGLACAANCRLHLSVSHVADAHNVWITLLVLRRNGRPTRTR
jgi:hypothetical protein